MGEPISRWSALLATVVSLPIACVVLAIGLAMQSPSLRGIGLAWLGVLGLLTLIVQVGVVLLNRHAARWVALPRAWASSRKPR